MAKARAAVVAVGRYCALAVGLSAVIVYLNAFGNEFVLDDTGHSRQPAHTVARSVPVLRVVMRDLDGARLYRPMVLASYAVNYALDGLSTYGYTGVNIGLHAAVSLLLFALVRGVGGSLFAAGASGMAFAVHPVHAEAVTGIAGRTELLAAFFFLLAMHFHRLTPGAGRSAAWYRAGALTAFACALLSKESAVTLLLVLPAMDALLPAKDSARQPAGLRSRIVADYLPLIAVALAYLAVRRAVLGAIVIAAGTIAPLDNPMVPITMTALGERLGATGGQAIMTAFAVVGEYARLLAWPARLSPDYSYNQIPLVTGAMDVRFLTGLVLAAACLCGVWKLWRRNPLAAFGLALLALTFSIVSNFVITIGTICAERLMYLPSAGALVAAASGAESLSRTKPRRLAAVVLAVAIGMCRARTWKRNLDWKNVLRCGLRPSRLPPAARASPVRPGSDRSCGGRRRRDARRTRAALRRRADPLNAARRSTRRMHCRWMASRTYWRFTFDGRSCSTGL
jgi:hypothetical protein